MANLKIQISCLKKWPKKITSSTVNFVTNISETNYKKILEICFTGRGRGQQILS